jgi:hypothetical protein
MAICPNCHTREKGFFAPKCFECNTEVGFFEQLITSVVCTITAIVVWVGGIYLLGSLLF